MENRQVELAVPVFTLFEEWMHSQLSSNQDSWSRNSEAVDVRFPSLFENCKSFRRELRDAIRPSRRQRGNLSNPASSVNNLELRAIRPFIRRAIRPVIEVRAVFDEVGVRVKRALERVF